MVIDQLYVLVLQFCPFGINEKVVFDIMQYLFFYMQRICLRVLRGALQEGSVHGSGDFYLSGSRSTQMF